MAPEAIALLQYSEKSDVWSFGVVTWEVMTNGQVLFGVYVSPLGVIYQLGQ